jgi:hypothetical protein
VRELKKPLADAHGKDPHIFQYSFSGSERGRRPMVNKEAEERIRTHQDIIAELNLVSPAIEAHQMKISRFILRNPMLYGISYPAAEILMNEHDPQVCQKAVGIIGKEIQKRHDPNSKSYRLVYRRISESRVRKILIECRPQTKKEAPAGVNSIPIEIACPHCGREIQCVQENRGNVVGFRVTEIEDNAIEYLAKRCGVSQSYLINALLVVEKRYGCALK